MTARIIGLLFSGFMVRAYGAAMALYVGIVAFRYVHHTYTAIQGVMG